jgi:large subunit ribosomal protein L6
MSRIGKQPIKIPENTEINISDNFVVIKGKLGELQRQFREEMKIEKKDNEIIIEPLVKSNFTKMYWGTVASHILNMIKGVNELYEKKLVVEGVGYNVSINADNLVLNLGFSHPVEMKIPGDVKVEVEKNQITISGIDKEKVGQFASKIKSKKKPEPYKGKGIRYFDEVIRRKQGKKAA